MEIHNLMEELVRAIVDEVSAEEQDRTGNRYCTSDECRTDATCYVLNRLPGRYVSSGRGYAHLTEELKEDHQLMVDVLRLVHEGLTRVSVTRRGYYDESSEREPSGPAFNFPTIRGRLLDGLKFFPVSGVAVDLLLEGEPAAMFDPRWSNPYRIADQTPGTFIFWPAAQPADRAGIHREWAFELHVADPEFEPFRHWFSIELESQAAAARGFRLDRDYALPDLYLFPR